MRLFACSSSHFLSPFSRYLIYSHDNALIKPHQNERYRLGLNWLAHLIIVSSVHLIIYRVELGLSRIKKIWYFFLQHVLDLTIGLDFLARAWFDIWYKSQVGLGFLSKKSVPALPAFCRVENFNPSLIHALTGLGQFFSQTDRVR